MISILDIDLDYFNHKNNPTQNFANTLQELMFTIKQFSIIKPTRITNDCRQK